MLFGDLVGFTTLSESRDAEDVRELLTAYFDECRAVVSRYGGELEKFIGDAVMAVWGLPITREDDAERAVRAGLELVERVAALGDRIGVPGLAMRVGLTTAEVAVTRGATGQGMVAGDPVNTAARIQSAAPPGEVWVDDTTRALTSSSIVFDDAGLHAMKGKSGEVQLWSVRAVVSGKGGDRRDDGLEGQLIGRDRELRLVKELFHRVEESLRPGLLVVDGEPGVGKTRLAWEFEKYVDGFEADVLWHRGRCLSYGEGVAYYALAEAVRGRLAILAGVAPAPGQDSGVMLQRGLEAAVPAAQERDWLEPRLAALLGLQRGITYPREELFVAWTSFFKYVGLWQADEPQPVVLVIDDAQHADEGLLAFFEHLLAAADFPVFVLVLARPELLAGHPELASNRRVTVVHLEPLSDGEMLTLLDTLVMGIPDALGAELAGRAEGVPLYAVETVRSLLDQELVVARNGRYVLADADKVDLTSLSAPTSLQALIAARLDTLPSTERLVVDRAAVLGLVFDGESIRALCGDVPALDEAVSGLVRRAVLRRETDRLSADFGSYRFVQGAVRQVAYGMLSRRDRKTAHLEVAAVLTAEMDRAGPTNELAPVIAQHFLDAIEVVPGDADVPELTRTASEHLERAADRATALGAPQEAARHLAKALDHCEAGRQVHIQSRLARQLRIAGDYEGAIEHATSAIKGLEASDDAVACAGPVEDLARALTSIGDVSRAEAVVRDHLERLPRSPDALRARAALVTTLAAVVLRAGDGSELRSIAEESVRLAELLDDPTEIADSWVTYAIACFGSGLPQLAVRLLENAADLAGEHRALSVQGIALHNLVAFALARDLNMGVRRGREADAVLSGLGNDELITSNCNNLAHVLLHRGEWSEALVLIGTATDHGSVDEERQVLRRLMALARDEEQPAAIERDLASVDDQSSIAMYHLDEALRSHGERRWDAAHLALSSVRHAQAVAINVDEFFTNWLFASDIACHARDREALLEMLPFVEDELGPWPPGVKAQRARLRALIGQDGSAAEAEVEAAFREALELVTVWGSTVFEAHICAEFGQWATRQGRPEQAAELLGRARDVYEQIGATRWLDELSQGTDEL